MGTANQDLVCDFARSIFSFELGTLVSIAGRPDAVERTNPAVEELWTGATHRFAVEHTLIESFPGQLRDSAAFMELMAPLDGLGEFMPGDFRLTIPAGAASSVRTKYDAVQKAVLFQLLKLTPTMAENTSATFRVPGADFDFNLRRRDGDRRQLRVWRSVGDDLEDQRLARITTALERKCPKVVETAAREAAVSVLLLESNDISLANFAVVTSAVRSGLQKIFCQPDIVILVETDGGSPEAWVIENKTDIVLRDNYASGFAR